MFAASGHEMLFRVTQTSDLNHNQSSSHDLFYFDQFFLKSAPLSHTDQLIHRLPFGTTVGGFKDHQKKESVLRKICFLLAVLTLQECCVGDQGLMNLIFLSFLSGAVIKLLNCFLNLASYLGTLSYPCAFDPTRLVCLFPSYLLSHCFFSRFL